MNCKQQLQAFYAKQGLTGKHRRQAMRYDMRAIRRATGSDWDIGRWDIGGSILWSLTPQGHAYWSARAYRL